MSETVNGAAVSSRINGFATGYHPPHKDIDPHREMAVAAARCVVADYLRDVGLRDPDLIAQESKRIVAQAVDRLGNASAVTEESLTTTAIKLTVKRLESLLAVLAADGNSPGESTEPGKVVGARLPGLLKRYTQAVKQHGSAVEAAQSLRGDAVSVVPKCCPREMRRQSLALFPALLRRLRPRNIEPVEATAGHPPSLPCTATPARAVLAVLTFVSTVLATWWFCGILAADGIGLLDFPLATLFAVLFLWVAFSFWMATLGFLRIMRRGRRVHSPHDNDQQPLPVTAILMPVYNEAPANVFANLRAIIHSLEATRHAGAFHLFVLSDTTKPDIWLEEERAWAKMVAELPSRVRVFYRHRPRNTSRKAGNIADFCSRWGEHYKYMVVLDADSVMAGDTLVEMVRRMERDDRLGILQAPPRPVNRGSFFARMQQFAAATYGPIFLEGFALWSECDGNYWGHNAIIRVQPFMEHCDLPLLPGAGPLGGEILSHDFVEAALMRRAGWKVCLAHDLEGSYEECPTTMLDFAQRDQRWCQGNMQHIRLLLAEGLHPASRLHLGMGAMSYLAAPLWLAFLVLTLVGAHFGGRLFVGDSDAPSGLGLFVLTMTMLLLPKLMGVIATLYLRFGQPGTTWYRIVASMLVETATSMLMAPVMMLLHSQFVASTLLGVKVKWNAQQREDRGVSLASAVAVHYPHTLLGMAAGLWVWLNTPGLLPWFSPVLAGLLLAVPLAMLLASVRAGGMLAHWQLLQIPEEVGPPEVLRAQHAALVKAVAEQDSVVEHVEPFVAVLHDPAFYALHLGILSATHADIPLCEAMKQELFERWQAGGPQALSPELRRAVLGDRRAVEALHVLTRSQPLRTTSALVA